MTSVVQTAKEWIKAATWNKEQMPDLTGRTFLVTGATDGVGRVAAGAFAHKNAHVVVHGRDLEKTQQAVSEIKAESPNAKVDYILGDLTSFKSIRQMVDEYHKQGWPLHVLLNNAGIQAPKGQRGQQGKTEEGFEITFGTNHFGPVYLTELLMPLIKKSAPSRIVWVDSLGSQLANPPIIGGNETTKPGFNLIPWDDLKGEKAGDSDWWAYSRTKLFNIMTCKEEARRLQGSGVEVLVAHPGLSTTDHFGKADTEKKWSSALVETFAKSPFGQSAEKGAISLEYACTSPDMDGKSGWYVGSPELGLVNSFNAHAKEDPNAPAANDPVACRRLYTETLRILREVDPRFQPTTEDIPLEHEREH